VAAPFIAPIIGIATIWGGLALWYQAPGMRVLRRAVDPLVRARFAGFYTGICVLADLVESPEALE
jgi:hypothetical protein